MTRLGVSAIVVSYGHRATLPTALTSLERIGAALREVVVVDNAGDLGDGLVSRCSPTPPSVLSPGENLGYAAAANLAVRSTRAELLLFLSPDAAIVDWSPDRIDELVCAPTVGAAGPLTVDSGDRPSVSWGEFPGLARGLRRMSGVRGRFDRRALDATASGAATAVPWVLGAAVLVRRETFDRVGGYDDFYAVAGEDQDFGRRLQLHGFRSVVSSAWRVRHEPRAGETLLPLIRRNEIRFLERHGSLVDRLLWALVYGKHAR